MGKFNFTNKFDFSSADSALGLDSTVSIDELHEFKGHPFKVKDDADMEKLVESVKENGIMEALLVRKNPDGDGYEIISGHRRRRAAELAGLDRVPVTVKDMDDDTAAICMVDSNLRREIVLPSEKAFAYKMKLEAMKHQGKRSDEGLDSVDQIVQDSDDSRSQIKRYIRLTYLTPDLLEMVDAGAIKLTPAVELSFSSIDDQTKVLDYMAENKIRTVTAEQAAKIREYSSKNELADSTIELIFQPDAVKPKTYKVTLDDDDVKAYFKPKTSAKEMHDIILQALAEWNENHKIE